MQVEFTDGSFLAFWYDSWLVFFGFVVALVLAVLVLASKDWTPTGLLLKTTMVGAVLGALPLSFVRLGIDISVGDETTVGYLSVVAESAGIVVGLTYVLRPLIQARRSARLLGEPVPGDSDVTAQFTATMAGEASGGQTIGGQEPTQAWLLLRTGPSAGQSIPLNPEGTTIGRGTENDVVLDDASVSRAHAHITMADGGFWVEDAGSMAGTLVDGAAATARQPLAAGTIIQLGSTEAVFMQTSARTQLGGTSSGPGATAQPGETMIIQQPEMVMAWLAVRSGPQKGTSYQLAAADATIGRDSDNTVVIADTGASRHHAVLRYQNGSFIAIDVGSRGGTRVNGKSVGGRGLSPGQQIQLGQSELTLVPAERSTSENRSTLSGQTIVESGPSAGGVLVAQSGPDAGRSFRLVEGDNIIGRDNDCSILMSDQTVSRRHSLVRVEAGQVTVFDLGSRSGTQVAGKRLSGQALTSGDLLEVGGSELVFTQVQPNQG